MVQCSIIFENNHQGIFYSGSAVSGRVEIVLNKPTAIRGINLIISGNAKVHWTETEQVTDHHHRHHGNTSSSSHTRTETIHYSASDKYLYTVTHLCAAPNGDSFTLNPGAHTYTFSCILPAQLPSSVEGPYGQIRYAAKVVFDRPWKFDKTYTVGFTVLKIRDLNYEHPAIRMPSIMQVQKTFWCWPCASKPLLIEVKIPQTGYVSGQNIPVIIDLFNESGKTINHVTVSLKKRMRCTSDMPRQSIKTAETTVKKMAVGQVQNIPKQNFHLDMTVPPLPPTSTELCCRIIQVSYELRIKTHIDGPHVNPVISMPIIIGNIPLHNHNNVAFNNLSEQITSMPSAPTIEPTAKSPSTPNSPEILAAEIGLPPPTYEEALYLENSVNMNSEEKHPIAESSYVPRYPVFNFNPTAPASEPSSSAAKY